jgi:hypothetical protein
VSDAVGAVQNIGKTLSDSITGAGSALQGATSNLTKGAAGLIPGAPKSSINAQQTVIKSPTNTAALALPSLPTLPGLGSSGSDPVANQSLLNVGGTDINIPILSPPGGGGGLNLPTLDLGNLVPGGGGGGGLNLPTLDLGNLIPGGGGGGLTLPGLTLPNLIGLGPFGGPLLGLPSGFPPSFGFQGSNAFPLGELTNGNNLFGLNFFFIGNDNLFVANNIGTGLQVVFAGDRNVFSGNQIISPTSLGLNLVSMGNDNGALLVPLTLPVGLSNLSLADLLSGNLSGLSLDLSGLDLNLADIVANGGSGNNLNTGLFSFGGNEAFLGSGDQHSGNDVVVGAFNLANNLAAVGNDSDSSGNNGVVGIGSTAFNTVFVGNGSDFSGNNSNENLLQLFGSATNFAFVGNDSDVSGNNFGLFNFALVGDNTDFAGNNFGLINFAILPGPGSGNCTGPVCVNLFGTQFGGSGDFPTNPPGNLPAQP